MEAPESDSESVISFPLLTAALTTITSVATTERKARMTVCLQKVDGRSVRGV